MFDNIMVHLTFFFVTTLPLTMAQDEGDEEDDQHPRKLLITKAAFSLSS